jgi:hypothetical protein
MYTPMHVYTAKVGPLGHPFGFSMLGLQAHTSWARARQGRREPALLAFQVTTRASALLRQRQPPARALLHCYLGLSWSNKKEVSLRCKLPVERLLQMQLHLHEQCPTGCRARRAANSLEGRGTNLTFSSDNAMGRVSVSSGSCWWASTPK